MEKQALSRRSFLRTAGLSAAAIAGLRKTSANPAGNATSINLPREPGTFYEATVPDTLDLAELGRLGLEHITAITREDFGYEMPTFGRFGTFNKPVLGMMPNSLQACQPKFMEASAYLRLMTGSDLHREREAKMLQMMTSHIGDEGIYWVYPCKEKPWLGAVEMGPNAHSHGQGDMLHALIAWYQYTGDPKWKELADRMVEGVDRVMLAHKDDYAYFPTHGINPVHYFCACYYKSGGWKDTEEPKDEKSGEEGSMFDNQGRIAEALANWYVLTGNRRALRVSGELVRFYLKPKFWADWKGGEYPGVVGAEHAHWRGHYHSYMNILQGILAYAQATNDPRLMAFVRDGYEWTRQAEWARIGLVGDGQGCGLARLIRLALRLTEAGVGDYWEDVDLYIRNQGTEMQIVPDDIPSMKKWGEGKPEPPPGPPHVTEYSTSLPGLLISYITDGAVESAIGGFSPTVAKTDWLACCSPWGNMGLFFAWDRAIRYANGIGWVNLLLNRASPWMDVDSFLPYEGKVILRNKQAKEAWVRIPLWVNKREVTCRVGEKPAHRNWMVPYLRFDGLKAGDELTIEFPVEERTENWTFPPRASSQGGWYFLPEIAGGIEHAIRFRGNTVVKLTPPLKPLSPAGGPGCWLYQRRGAKYVARSAPMSTVTRHVTPTVLNW